MPRPSLVIGSPLALRLLSTLLLGMVVLAGCAGTSPNGPAGSAQALPTGLVGPVAPTVGPDALRFVVLGDSYPFGDGVPQADRWANQLVRILRPDVDMEIAANLSGRKTASAQVVENQLPQLEQLEPQFVAVQVGVNDALTDTPPADYAANMAIILDTVLARVHRPDRVVVITAADAMLTPDGPSYVHDPAATGALTRQLNDILREAAETRGIAVVDISPVSDRVQEDPSLVAPAPTGYRLHPSGKQYAGWADLIATTVLELFQEPSATDMPGVTSGDASEAPEPSSGVPGASVSP